MQKQPVRLWITVLLIGWCFDFLFYKHTPGISFAIYAAITLAGGVILLWLDGIRPAKKTLILVPLILYFAVMTFVRVEAMSAFLSYAFSLFLMAGFAVTYRGGEWLRYSVAEYISRALGLLGSMLGSPLFFAAESQRLKREAGQEEKRPGAVWSIVRGLLFAIPVLVFFAALLSSADMIFAQRLATITALFRLENLPEYIFRAIYIAILAYVLAGVYLHAANRSSDEKLLGIDKPVVPPFLGFPESTVVLGSVVLLFAAFVVIQFQYFFGGQANIQIEGYTFAEYARKGFGELVAVAFFALLLFLGLSSITRRETPRKQGIFSALGVALVALVAVMLVSAYYRLVLYETAYGFTRLRTYTHVFMIWVAVLLAVVVILDLLRRQRAFALAALFAALGFALSLTLLNVDAFIFQQNILRFEQGQDLDVGYLASLSSDAVPAMVTLYQSSAADKPTRDRVGAALACFYDQAEANQPDASWQAFHLSTYRANTALSLVADSLKAYQFDRDSYPIKVKTPLGKTFDCFSAMYD
ncbi:MAG: DUF4173 domain-containing protein [Chloroflexi bacterium]|nr:DUF4173 domain-containing protein [Chloroflexota bacterium]